ncbi:MAG TPA: right-handed parallel beta-helix repeat-containing protein [Terracidiphilus sp.]|nr:right-handed parallel beta-helix repeat-containing protein [Terracidiphilus sp.]
MISNLEIVKNYSPDCRIRRRVLPLVVLSLAAASLASAATLCVNSNGKGGCKSTISAAVAAASAGDTIQVYQGTYKEQVTITQSLSLIAAPNAQPVIEAKGKSNGIFVNGLAATPNAGVANVVISGFTVRDANFEGILVVNGSNVTLVDNHVLDNNKALEPSAGACPGIPAFETNEQMDCGEGIHLMAVDHSTVIRNLVENNSGGILITDETGPTGSNLIKGNNVHDNPYACGITMAGHPAANASGPIANAPSYGIMHNVISHNDSHHNGLGLPGAGAGIGIFAPGPGTTNTANVITGNELHDNGLPGVTMHNHGSAPAPAPGVNLNDNIIVGNHIYGNAADTEDAATSGPTGINIYSTVPVTGTVIAQNDFRDESIEIAFKAPGGWITAHFNDFNDRGIGIDNLGTGLIDATENWWRCSTGPSSKCSSIAGSGVSFNPWLTQPFDFNPVGYW